MLAGAGQASGTTALEVLAHHCVSEGMPTSVGPSQMRTDGHRFLDGPATGEGQSLKTIGRQSPSVA